MRNDERLFYKNLGILLKEEREKQGFSQEGLAAQIGVNQPALSRIESGSQQITVFNLFIACSEFGLNVHDVIDEAIIRSMAKKKRGCYGKA